MLPGKQYDCQQKNKIHVRLFFPFFVKWDMSQKAGFY